MKEDFFGIGEASRILGLSRTSLQKLVDAGKIPAVKTAGGHRRIARDALHAVHPTTGPRALIRTLALPAAERPQALTVLLVEDDAAVAALVAGLFGDAYPDVNFLLASDGLDAVLMLERNRPQILITELNMQPFDGFKLLQLVSGRPEYQPVALVVSSAMSRQEVDRRGELPANTLFLSKPLDVQRLRGFVDAHVQLCFANARPALMRNMA